MPELIDNGHLYLAVPPLYRLSHGGKTFYARDDKHKDEILKKEFHANAKVEIGRFKGLGEMMAAQLKETTMDRKKRTLLQVRIVAGRREGHREIGRAADGQQGRGALRVHPGARGVRQRGHAGRLACADRPRNRAPERRNAPISGGCASRSNSECSTLRLAPPLAEPQLHCPTACAHRRAVVLKRRTDDPAVAGCGARQWHRGCGLGEAQRPTSD